jgi:uncharacterized protein YceH (UPF0502 family)
MAARATPLVEQLPLGPRERDRRWRHLLGDAGAVAVPVAEAAAAIVAPAPLHAGAGDLATRVAELERQVRALQEAVEQLRAR